MSKTISAYGNFTANEIKTRASIPLQSQMTVSGNNVICDNLTLAHFHNVIQSSCYDAVGLFTSPRVNKWSNFSPKKWRINSNYLEIYTPFPNVSGTSIAGYNHNAVPCRVVTEHSTNLANINPVSNTFTVTIAINSGEINWPTITGGANISTVGMKVYDSLGQLKDTKFTDLVMKSGDQIPFLTSNTITSTDTTDKTWYVQVYFGSITGDLIAYFPDIKSTTPVPHHYTFLVKYLGNPTFIYGADYSATSFTGSFLTMMSTNNVSNVDIPNRTINVDFDLALAPTFSDCGGQGNYPRFNNSPLIYNADIKLTKGDTGYVYWFYDVVPGGNKECVDYANMGDNANPPYQSIVFSYQLPVGNNINYGDNLEVYIKRRKSTFGYVWCNAGVPTIVTP